MGRKSHLFVLALTCLFLSTQVIPASNAADPISWDVLKTVRSDDSVEAVLIVDGKLKENNLIKFDMDSLLQLPAVTFGVSHPRSGNKNQYTGILLDEFLDNLGLASEAEYVIIKASNDYKAAVKIEDINRYEYLLSYKKNGKLYEQLPADQNRGPLAIVINFDKHSKLDYDIYKHQLVWFVESITVK